MRASSLSFVLACALLVHPIRTLASGDYDDGDDDFWRDAPAKPRPKETVDPKTGERLVGMTYRFFQIRLKPDRRRTQASTEALAAELGDLFFNGGMSHNKPNAAGTHVMVVQTRDEWDEVKDIIFSLPDVYDVTTRDGVQRKPGLKKPYSEVWRKEMGEGVPVPLDDQQPPPAPTARPSMDASKKTKKSKKHKKGQTKQHDAKGGQHSTPEL